MNKDQTLGIIRHVLTFVGGILVARGLVDAQITTEIVGSVITLAGAVWSAVAPEKNNTSNQ